MSPISREGTDQNDRGMWPEWSIITATHPVLDLQWDVLAYFDLLFLETRSNKKKKNKLWAALGEVHELSQAQFSESNISVRSSKFDCPQRRPHFPRRRVWTRIYTRISVQRRV